MATRDETPGAEARSEGEKAQKKVGPDPVVGVGIFVVGLFTMATGGATTMHYLFNAGEGLVLLGAVVFLVSVAISAHRQNPTNLRALARSALGSDEPDGDAPPAQPRD